MKINISRQNIYLLAISTFLLIFVFIFAFALLIPEGKDYRNSRHDLKKLTKELKKYEDFRDESLEELINLQSEKRNIITAFDKDFDALRFKKMHSNYFHSLKVLRKKEVESEGNFTVYNINTISQINSPTSFYSFLDAINKSDWIIAVNFPINFKREGELIHSSFTMKVYGIKEKNLRKN